MSDSPDYLRIAESVFAVHRSLPPSELAEYPTLVTAGTTAGVLAALIDIAHSLRALLPEDEEDPNFFADQIHEFVMRLVENGDGNGIG